jgi:hypothetical protein
MRQEKERKQRQNRQQKKAPRDNYAEAVKYNKKYHEHDKILNKIFDHLLESTSSFGKDMKRPATVGELISFVGLIHMFLSFRANQVESRCVMGEYLLEDTWDMLKRIAKRVNAKADAEKLAIMEQRLSNMRSEDASLNEKFDRIEPFLESFGQYLDSMGLKPEDLFKWKSPTTNEQP